MVSLELRSALLVCALGWACADNRAVTVDDAGATPRRDHGHQQDAATPLDTGQERDVGLARDAWRPDRDLANEGFPPPPPDSCQPGERRWCDGLQFSSWGQVSCDAATGTWKTKTLNGMQVLDCIETADGSRPATACACYHFFFNPTCCEQPDCRLPPGTTGQLCPKSPGALCDYCNPMDPECVEPGAKCIVTNSHENFCGRECSSTPCPAGYACMTVKLKQGTTQQCVPSDLSCFY